jgi:hypothetical protein
MPGLSRSRFHVEKKPQIRNPSILFSVTLQIIQAMPLSVETGGAFLGMLIALRYYSYDAVGNMII